MADLQPAAPIMLELFEEIKLLEPSQIQLLSLALLRRELEMREEMGMVMEEVHQLYSKRKLRSAQVNRRYS